MNKAQKVKTPKLEGLASKLPKIQVFLTGWSWLRWWALVGTVRDFRVP
jgi:hypothetical protein